MRFLLAGSGGSLVLLGKQESDPGSCWFFAPPCVTSACYSLFWKKKHSYCIDKGNERGFSCNCCSTRLPLHFTLPFVSWSIFFPSYSRLQACVGFHGCLRASEPEAWDATASAELAVEEPTHCVGWAHVGTLRKHWKSKIKGISAKGLVNVDVSHQNKN